MRRLNRQARESDLKGLKEFCERVHKESKYGYIAIHEKTLLKTLQQVLLSPHGFAWVALVDGKIEGAILGVANQLWFSRKKEAVDLFFHVSEKAKGAGAVLVRRYISWGRMTPGIERIMIGVTSGQEVERAEAFFRAMGAERVGGMYCIDVNSSEESDEQRSQNNR